MTEHPYRVRQIKSGYNGQVKFIVVRIFKGGYPGRVTVVAHLSHASAQLEADDLNISEMVKDYADDPLPYDVRRREAYESYYFERDGS